MKQATNGQTATANRRTYQDWDRILQNGGNNMSDRQMDELVGNLLQSRSQLFSSFFDRGHNIDEDCGYPDVRELTPDYYRDLYDRDPLASRAVQLFPYECWQGQPTVYEAESNKRQTPFELAWDEMCNSMMPHSVSHHQDELGSPFWDYLKRADVLSGIGQFGVILLGIDDGRNLQDAADGVEVIANTIVNGVRCREVIPDSPGGPAEPKEWSSGEHEYKLRVHKGDFFASNRAGERGSGSEEVVVKCSETLKPNPTFWKPETEAMVMTDAGRFVFNRRTGDLAQEYYPPQMVANLKALSISNGKDELTANALALGAGFPAFPASPRAKKQPKQPRKGQAPDRPLTPAPGDGPFVQGTDKQYSQGFGLGMPAPSGGYQPSLSGTDQQYFGVQFGPSEAFADQPSKQEHRLVFLRPFDESLVQIVRYEWNIRNPRFGLPVMYRITLNDPRQPHSGVGLPLATVYVHWSRVIHLADNLHASEIFGIPRLQPILNPILDCRKIRAASAEGYWQSCFVGLSLESHPTLGGDAEMDRGEVRRMMHDWKSHLQRYLVLIGMSAKTIAPSVVDPTNFHNIQEQAICIKLGCPLRVWRGAERGELASSQDDEAWNERKRERQVNYMTPKIIVPLVDRLIQLGILPLPDQPTDGPATNSSGVRRMDGGKFVHKGIIYNAKGKKIGVSTPVGYHVEWPDLDALGDADKAAIALQTTQACVAYVSGGVEQIIPPEDFLQRVLGWEEVEAETVIDDAQKNMEKQQEEQASMAQEQGFEPEPPQGFRDPDDQQDEEEEYEPEEQD